MQSHASSSVQVLVQLLEVSDRKLFTMLECLIVFVVKWPLGLYSQDSLFKKKKKRQQMVCLSGTGMKHQDQGTLSKEELTWKLACSFSGLVLDHHGREYCAGAAIKSFSYILMSWERGRGRDSRLDVDF